MSIESIKLDTQQKEILGCAILKSYLIAGGIEVASPERDNGIDLIAYKFHNSFNAFPIQMKSSANESFSINKKYESIPGLWMAYVWHIQDPQRSSVYFMKYNDAIEIGNQMGWTKTDSWNIKGEYSNSSPGGVLKKLIIPYKMDVSKLRDVLK